MTRQSGNPSVLVFPAFPRSERHIDGIVNLLESRGITGVTVPMDKKLAAFEDWSNYGDSSTRLGRLATAHLQAAKRLRDGHGPGALLVVNHDNEPAKMEYKLGDTQYFGPGWEHGIGTTALELIEHWSRRKPVALLHEPGLRGAPLNKFPAYMADRVTTLSPLRAHAPFGIITLEGRLERIDSLVKKDGNK